MLFLKKIWTHVSYRFKVSGECVVGGRVNIANEEVGCYKCALLESAQAECMATTLELFGSIQAVLHITSCTTQIDETSLHTGTQTQGNYIAKTWVVVAEDFTCICLLSCYSRCILASTTVPLQ